VNPDPDDLRARLAALPRETLRQILMDTVRPTDAAKPDRDGSLLIRVPAQGAPLMFRLSADDLRL
jgi:hypothetical protein